MEGEVEMKGMIVKVDGKSRSDCGCFESFDRSLEVTAAKSARVEISISAFFESSSFPICLFFHWSGTNCDTPCGEIQAI